MQSTCYDKLQRCTESDYTSLAKSINFVFQEINEIKLCLRGVHTCAQPFFRYCDLDINLTSLKLESGLDIYRQKINSITASTS